MHYTLELLIKGNPDVVDYYREALAWWKTVIADNPTFDVERLSMVLTAEQAVFERKCGGRFVGQEIMVIVGIGQFYTTEHGWDQFPSPVTRIDANGKRIRLTRRGVPVGALLSPREKAQRIYKGIMKSYCSVEVKGYADEVAQSYQLLED